MTFEEVNSLFKKRLEKLEVPIFICQSAVRDHCNAFKMPSYVIGKENYNIEFEFIDNQLSKVALSCESDNNNENPFQASRCYDNISYLLTQKYGDPIKSEENEDEGSKYLKIKTTYRKNKLEWESSYTKINLFYLACNGDCGTDKTFSTDLRVTYSPNLNKVKINTKLYESEKDKI